MASESIPSSHSTNQTSEPSTASPVFFPPVKSKKHPRTSCETSSSSSAGMPPIPGKTTTSTTAVKTTVYKKGCKFPTNKDIDIRQEALAVREDLKKEKKQMVVEPKRMDRLQNIVDKIFVDGFVRLQPIFAANQTDSTSAAPAPMTPQKMITQLRDSGYLPRMTIGYVNVLLEVIHLIGIEYFVQLDDFYLQHETYETELPSAKKTKAGVEEEETDFST